MVDISVGVRKVEKGKDAEESDSCKSLQNYLQQFTDHFPHRIAVQGHPGMGKTTLCQQISLDWKQHKTPFSAFKLLFLIPLRCLESKYRSMVDMIEKVGLFAEGDLSSMEKQMLEEYIGSNPQDICFVLDGYGELNPYLHKPILDLWNSDKLRKLHILMSVRPEFMYNLEKSVSVDYLFELAGFDDDRKKEYIKIHFSTSADGEQGNIGNESENNMKKATEMLVDNVSGIIQPLTNNPLNMALMCMLLEENQEELPQTRTALLRETVLCFLKRTIIQSKHNLKPTEFKKLIIGVRQRLVSLTKFAYENVLERVFVFSNSEIQDRELNAPEKHLGLLRLRKTHVGHNKEMQEWHFLHPYFQEFMAAYWMVSCNDKTYVSENAYQLPFMSHNVKLFSCGFGNESSAQMLAEIAAVCYGGELNMEWLDFLYEGLLNCELIKKDMILNEELSEFFRKVCDTLAGDQSISIRMDPDVGSNTMGRSRCFECLFMDQIQHKLWRQIQVVTLTAKWCKLFMEHIRSIQVFGEKTTLAKTISYGCKMLQGLETNDDDIMFSVDENSLYAKVVINHQNERKLSGSTRRYQKACEVFSTTMYDLTTGCNIQQLEIDLGFGNFYVPNGKCVSELVLGRHLTNLHLRCQDTEYCANKCAERTRNGKLIVLFLELSEKRALPVISDQTFVVHPELKYVLLKNCLQEEMDVLRDITAEKCLQVLMLTSDIIKEEAMLRNMIENVSVLICIGNEDFKDVASSSNSIKRYQTLLDSTDVDTVLNMCYKQTSLLYAENKEILQQVVVAVRAYEGRNEAQGPLVRLHMWYHPDHYTAAVPEEDLQPVMAQPVESGAPVWKSNNQGETEGAEDVQLVMECDEADQALVQGTDNQPDKTSTGCCACFFKLWK